VEEVQAHRIGVIRVRQLGSESGNESVL
jgi:hypothetical protein